MFTPINSFSKSRPTLISSLPSQDVGWKERLRNDLFVSSGTRNFTHLHQKVLKSGSNCSSCSSAMCCRPTLGYTGAVLGAPWLLLLTVMAIVTKIIAYTNNAYDYNYNHNHNQKSQFIQATNLLTFCIFIVFHVRGSDNFHCGIFHPDFSRSCCMSLIFS